MRRDTGRERLPDGYAWNLINLLPVLGATARQRGGYGYASNDIAAVTATASYVIGGIYATFSAAAKNLALDEDGRLYSIATDGTVTDIGAAVVVSQNPVFHRNKVIIWAEGGATGPQVYDGTTLGALGGSPPNAIYSCVYKDRTVAARTTANLERLWFSGPGNPASWDTTNSWWDTSYHVTGLAALRNAILIFSDGHVERLRGSIPPPGSDFILDPLFDVGCTDARSIAHFGDNIIWANPEGIYITDGSAIDDLTESAGMKLYWAETLAGYSASTHTLVASTIRGFYLIFIMNGSAFVDAAMIDARKRAWIRLSNIDGRSAWRAVTGSEELYFGRRGAARVGKLSSIFTPSATVKNDADGTAVGYTYEGPFNYAPGLKRFGRLYISHDTRDASADDPILTVSYITSPESTSYTTITGTLAETTALTRVKRGFGASGRYGIQAQGLGLKIVKTNASSDARLYAIEGEVAGKEPSGV